MNRQHIQACAKCGEREATHQELIVDTQGHYTYEPFCDVCETNIPDGTERSSIPLEPNS